MKRFYYLTGALCLAAAMQAETVGQMSVELNGRAATMSNGIITLNIGADGRAGKMYHQANGSSNILGSSGIYFDYTADKNRSLSPSTVEVVRLTEDYAEVIYSNTSDALRFQQGYILRAGVSGVYSYVIANGTKTSNTVTVKEARVCTRLASSFLNGYVDDVMQGRIPSNSEMSVAEKSENTVQDATYYLADGSVYTKYNWAQFIDRDLFHGLTNGTVGVWNIPVSYEWINGGPMRQELTVHSTSKSPITIQMLQGEHLGGAAVKYEDGERQIFGPFFIYVNSGASQEEMIADARREAQAQQAQWPYQWFENELYPLDRTTVKGRINLTTGQSPADIQVVLAEPGTELIRQGKKYIFWAKTDEQGNFSIPNVRKGSYALRAYATSGIITDELEKKDVVVDGEVLDLGTVDWTPVTYKHLLWSIGENNRLSDGYNLSSAPRAYGLWEQVPADLEFEPGVSDEATDWYYAQCHNGSWKIKFNVDEPYEGTLHLTGSIAGATNNPRLTVRINGTNPASWNVQYNDAAIYRSATQAGRHCTRTYSFPASALKQGENIIELRMSGISKNGGILWDCLKLESELGPGESGLGSIVADNLPYTLYTVGGVRVGEFESLGGLSLPAGVYIYTRGTERGKVIL